MRSRWYHVPALHTADSGEKKASWLELFYDLIFVAAFIQLGNGLAARPTLEGFLVFSAVFVPIWLTWTGFTYYANRFTVDDFTHRMLVFAQMFAVGGMAIFAPDVLAHKPTRFVICYALAQALVGVLYVRTWRQIKQGRDYSAYWGGVFGVGAVLWGVSAVVPTPWNYLLWAVGIGAILSSPFGRRSRVLMERYPVDFEHLGERYGLLTLIVLGESFVKVLSAISADEASLHVLGQAALTLLITCSLWWIYFDDVAGSQIKKGRISPMMWLFGHIPVQLGITATGVALKKAALFDLGEVAPAKYRWILCVALATAMLGVAMLDSVTARKQSEMSDRARINVRIGSAAVILLTAQVGGAMPAWLFLLIISAMCFAQVFFDMMMAPLLADAHHHLKTVAEETRNALAEGRAPPRPDTAQLGQVVRKGTPNDLRRDLYFYLMEGSWFRVFATIAFLYFLANVVFAGLYMLEPGSVVNARPDSFADHFFFSVQTMSTVGYGGLVPATPYGNMLMTVQVAMCMIMVALATGLMFAKASRAKASVLFSETLVVTRRYGLINLMFRAGNARGNEIIDANMSLSVLRDEVTPEGDHMRRLYDLKLERSRQPFFQMTWSVMHVVDGDSPLKDVDWSDPERAIIMVAAILTGHDGTYGQTVYARHNYTAADIRVHHRFVDVISQLPDGRMMIDYEKFHHTVPTDPSPTTR